MKCKKEIENENFKSIVTYWCVEVKQNQSTSNCIDIDCIEFRDLDLGLCDEAVACFNDLFPKQNKSTNIDSQLWIIQSK